MGRMIRYRELKQFGRYYTKKFHEQQKRKAEKKIPVSRVPDMLLNKFGIEVVDPLSPDFPHPREKVVLRHNHPAIKQELSDEEHPLYKSRPCFIHDGSKPLADGLKQALNLVKGVARMNLPETLTSSVDQVIVDNMKEAMIRSIMQSQEWDPTLKLLPRRQDETLWWIGWPRYYGIPFARKNEILLDNMLRQVLSMSGKFTDLKQTVHFKDGQVSAMAERNDDLMQVIFKPRITMAHAMPLKPFDDDSAVARTSKQPVVDVYPIGPKIDLKKTNVYDDSQIYPLMWTKPTLVPRTIMLSQDMDYKYPWTPTEIVANAIMAAFGLAASCAHAKYTTPGVRLFKGILPEPITVQCIQLCGGTFDFVIFQLNTLDLANDDGVKNTVWIDESISNIFISVYDNLAQPSWCNQLGAADLARRHLGRLIFHRLSGWRPIGRKIMLRLRSLSKCH